MAFEEAPAPPMRHSTPGIISVAISLTGLAAWSVMITGFLVAIIGANRTPLSGLDAESVVHNGAVAMVLCLVSLPVASVISLLLGIIGLLDRSTKRLFPILGTSLSIIITLVSCGFFVFLMLLGSNAQGN